MRRSTTVLCRGRLTNELYVFRVAGENVREKRVERLRVVWKDPTGYVIVSIAHYLFAGDSCENDRRVDICEIDVFVTHKL